MSQLSLDTSSSLLPKQYPGFLWSLLGIVFFTQVDHLLMVPLCADIAKETGFRLEQSGLLVSIYPISGAISAFFCAPFSDRLGRKTMLAILVAGFSIATIGCALSQSAASIFIFRILSGVFGGVILPNAMAFAGDAFEGSQRIRALTALSLAFPLASIMGTPIGAWLGDLYSWRISFIVIVVGTIICSLWLFRCPAIATGAERKTIFKQYAEFLKLWTFSEIRLVFIIQFFMLVGLFGVVPHLSVWLTFNYQMTATEIGICYMQGGIGAIFGNMVARHLLHRGHRIRLIVAGSLFMGVILWVATSDALPSYLIGAGFAGIMFGGAIRTPALQLILSELMPASMRGRLLIMSMIVSNITMGVGGLWSFPLLTIENNTLSGMGLIGFISFLSSCLVPFFAFFLFTSSNRGFLKQ
jgi:predicted MFS family arabinose efflux permease